MNSTAVSPSRICLIRDLEIAIAKAIGAVSEHHENWRIYYAETRREEIRDGWIIKTENRLVFRAAVRSAVGPAPKLPLLYPTEEDAWRAYLDRDQYGEGHHYVTDDKLFGEIQRYLLNNVGGYEVLGPARSGITGRVLCKVGPLQLIRDGASLEEAVCRAFLASLGKE